MPVNYLKKDGYQAIVDTDSKYVEVGLEDRPGFLLTREEWIELVNLHSNKNDNDIDLKAIKEDFANQVRFAIGVPYELIRSNKGNA